MSFEIEVTTKIPKKIKIQISNEQEKFCQLYARDKKMAGNSYECYLKVYSPTFEPHQTLEVVKKEAKALLTKEVIKQRITQLLEEDGFNDENVDKQHLFLINQYTDFSTKMKGIEHYNKLKKRTNDVQINIMPQPIMDWEDAEPVQLNKQDFKVIEDKV